MSSFEAAILLLIRPADWLQYPVGVYLDLKCNIFLRACRGKTTAVSFKKEKKKKKKKLDAVETQSQSPSPNTSGPECFEENALWKEQTLSWHVARRCININVVFSQNVCTLCPPWDKRKLKDISISLILLLSSLKLISRVLITFYWYNAAQLFGEITIALLVSGLQGWYAQLISDLV